MYSDKQFIFKASWKLSKLYEKSLSALGTKWGLTQSEMDVLIYLHYNRQKNTSRDIADYRSISKSLICKSVASLIQKCLIYCEQDKLDARMMRLNLTEAGLARAEELALCCESLCQDVFAGMSETEIRFLEHTILHLQENGKKRFE